MKPKLRRTIYIGLGGTGADTVSLVKEYFMKNSSTGYSVPRMVKFLCIDTNANDLQKIPYLTEDEKLLLTVKTADGKFRDDPSFYDWMPRTNLSSISLIGGNGAGQTRSNGNFIFCATSRNTSGRNFKSVLTQIERELTNALVRDNDYDLLDSAAIDVHLVFSLCGGTGSGMFLSVANAIKEHFNNTGCNLVGYAFSHSFYTNVGIHFNVKPNSFGALLELDYCMSLNNPYYTEKCPGINYRPFDAVMYVDNNTYTKDGEPSYTYTREQVLSNVSYAMALAAGSLGAESSSIVDNLKNAINSGGYDKRCKNGMKVAWISSLGVSTILCKPSIDTDLFEIRLARQEIAKLIGDKKDTGAETAKEWIKVLKINECGKATEGDNDELINEMINPALFNAITTIGIQVNAGGVVNDVVFNNSANNTIDFNEAEQNKKSAITNKKLQITQLVEKALFPENGGETCGINFILSVLSNVSMNIGDYSKQMSVEITDKNATLLSNNTTLEQTTQKLVAEEKAIITKQTRINAYKQQIMNIVRDNFIIKCEIKRRELAISVYADLAAYISELISSLTKLNNVLDDTNTSLQKEDLEKSREKGIKPESTSIDLSDKISNFEELNNLSKYKIGDWSKILTKCQFSLTDLHNKKDWHTFMKSELSSLYPLKSRSLLISILEGMKDESNENKELSQIASDALKRARPLMDITNYGVDIEPSEFIFVSLPVESTEGELDYIKDAFNKAYTGTTSIQFLSHNDLNQIIIYRQLGVVPPFYLKGISEEKNGVYSSDSCEEAYSKLRPDYVPFTNNFFEDAIKKGHGLDNVPGGFSEDNIIDIWVNCFILGFMKRGADGKYKIKHKSGKIDIRETTGEKWLVLGSDRIASYNHFKDNGMDFVKGISEIQAKMLKDPKIKADFDKYFLPGFEKNNLYRVISLFDFENGELDIPENEELYILEIDNLERRTNE